MDQTPLGSTNQQPPLPNWANPSPPPRRFKPWQIAGMGCSGVLALLFVIGLIGAIVDPQKANTASSTPAARPHTTTASTPSTTPKPSASPDPAPSTAQATAAPAPPSGDTHLAPLESRQKATAILRANDAYYRDEFNNGVTVILARGNPGSFDAFHAWFEKASKDVQPGWDAFSQADANFDASNEPPSISDWRDDSGTLAADVFQLANDGLDVGGPDDANARQKVQADIAKMKDDFAKAEQDAANIEAGK